MKANSITSYLGTGMLALTATVGQAWMVSGAARAADTASAPSMHINVRDLDLSRSSDVATLYARIKTAAHQVCDSYAPTGSRLVSGSKEQCLAQAVDGAVAQINNASLSAYHKQEAGKRGA